MQRWIQGTLAVSRPGLGVPDNFLENLGSGHSLDSHSRAAMESHFGEGFNDVRLHTDGRAAASAKAVDALAFTHGRDIVFGAGQYRPDTHQGTQLLAHELTHVLQQRGQRSGLQRKPLTPAERAQNLASAKYGTCPRLQLAFDDNPPVRFGERGQAVRLIQEGLVAAGHRMPLSTKPTGELDGIFGEETLAVVRQFQQDSNGDVTLVPHGEPDGLVGRITLGNLERMLAMGFRLSPCPASGTPPKATAAPCEGPDGCLAAAPPPKGETTKCQQVAFILGTGEFLNGSPTHIRVFSAGPSIEITFQNFDTSPASITIAEKLSGRSFALTVRPKVPLSFTTNSTTASCTGTTGVRWDLEIRNPSANPALVQFVIRSNWRPGVVPCCE
jgi:peptidoglycan hydrolase-like protein with peptidoglycan-binding domain